MRMNCLLIALILIVIPSAVFAGTAYYVDGSSPTDGDGSYSKPWNNISSVNKHIFNKGDDVYFKENTIITLRSSEDRLIVDWSGTSQDNVIIGCYRGKGDFKCSSTPYIDGNRAIIDGNKNTYPDTEQGLVNIDNQSYVTIRELKLQNAGKPGTTGKGIDVRNSNNINVENCYIYRDRSGIMYSKVKTGLISNNFVDEIGYPDWGGAGAAVEITAANSLGATTNITVSKNKVLNSKNEGIGFYKGVTNSVMEYNVANDIRAAHLYDASSPNNTIRYNLVYDTKNGIFVQDGTSGSGITVDIESWRNANAFNNNNTKIYGNMVAGLVRGISIGCGENQDGDRYTSTCYDGSVVYNNTLVDNGEYDPKYGQNGGNFALWYSNPNIKLSIKNNLSVTYSKYAKNISCGPEAGSCGVKDGFIWDNNFFNIPQSGDAGKSEIVGDPQLTKQSGWHWQDLSLNELKGTEFLPSANGPTKDSGISIPGFTNQITSADFTADPISVTLSNITSGSIRVGAWNLKSNTSQLALDPPSGVMVKIN